MPYSQNWTKAFVHILQRHRIIITELQIQSNLTTPVASHKSVASLRWHWGVVRSSVQLAKRLFDLIVWKKITSSWNYSNGIFNVVNFTSAVPLFCWFTGCADVAAAAARCCGGGLVGPASVMFYKKKKKIKILFWECLHVHPFLSETKDACGKDTSQHNLIDLLALHIQIRWP